MGNWEGQEREMSLKIIGGISKDRGSTTRIDFKPWHLIVHNIYKGEDSVVSRYRRNLKGPKLDDTHFFTGRSKDLSPTYSFITICRFFPDLVL